MNQEIIYVFKQGKLHAQIKGEECYLFKNNALVLDNSFLNEIVDILPEGIDLKIMLEAFCCKNPIRLLPYLKNSIGDFSFSFSANGSNLVNAMVSNIHLEQRFPNILNANLEVNAESLNPKYSNFSIHNNLSQHLSLSGYQHKLQVSIIDNTIRENYADFILKPANDDFCNLAINEHLNVSFMREFGFKVPHNAIIYDKNFRQYHYLIQRFDRDKKGNALPQISLNALMRSEDKYKGSIEKICHFLKDKLCDTQKMLFLQYIYANALVFNNDLHKKNISFIFDNNGLNLSPVYDVINIYVIRKLQKTQCILHINGKLNRIQIEDFKQSSEILELDFYKVRDLLTQTLGIYLNAYPKYVERLSEIPNLVGVKELKHKFLESYRKNLKLAQMQNLNLTISPNSPNNDEEEQVNLYR